MTTRAAIIGLAVFAVCIFVNISVNIGVVRGAIDRTPPICLPLPVASDALRTLNKIDLFVNVALPYVVVVVLPTITCCRMATDYFRFRRMAAVTSRPRPAWLATSELRLTRTCCVLALVIVVLQTPSHVPRAIHLVAELLQLPAGIDGRALVVLNVVHVLYFASFAAPPFVLVASHRGIRRRAARLVLDLLTCLPCRGLPRRLRSTRAAASATASDDVVATGLSTSPAPHTTIEELASR